jgi:uncharacterized protein YbjT (DUF2867 family)
VDAEAKNTKQMNAIIIGATGLVGQQLLRLLLGSGRYQEVHYIGRRRIAVDDGKLVQHITSLDALADLQLHTKFDDAYCTLGTTIKVAGSEAAFSKVDRDYVCAFGAFAKRHGATAMAVNSSLGAASKSSNFYLRTKGEMEDCLKACGFESLVIVRPSLLVPTGRKVSRAGEVVAFRVMQLLGWLMVGPARRYRPVSPTAVSHAMLDGAIAHAPGTIVVESEAMLSRAG